jgi:hypothetical protein
MNLLKNKYKKIKGKGVVSIEINYDWDSNHFLTIQQLYYNLYGMFLVKKKTQDTNRLDYEGFEPTI